MLNTALHNRNVKTPLTLDGFITMYHGIDEGRDVPRELLEVYCVYSLNTAIK